jgi:hypothetical protein
MSLSTWWNNLTTNVNTGLTQTSEGVGNAVNNLLTPTGGFLNNLMGKTEERTITTQAPDASSQSSSKTLTIVVVALAVITLVVVGVIVIKASKSS